MISAKFEGKQVYGTVCDKCGYKSERESNFLEIEVNLQVRTKLSVARVILTFDSISKTRHWKIASQIHCSRRNSQVITSALRRLGL